MSAVWDVGLQPERTSLAWRRTCLLLAVGAGLSVRYGLGNNSLATVGVAAGVVMCSLVAYALVSRRYRYVSSSLTANRSTLPPAGMLVLFVALGASLLAAAVATLLVLEAAG